ncbi:MAG: PAS domain-containing sensor histidine kinase, partial [Deltaproteobacteria bacterium]|nr:PAS domain-containing sensor histidine kinase [Deltaproteobacteria bacterium]
ERLTRTERATLNILEDAAEEKDRLQEAQRAVLNILEDAAEEKERVGRTERAMLNILEDSAEEKVRLEETQRAVLNILEDSAEEKARLEGTQRAMLNILEDFDVERMKTEAANRELREAFESLRRAKEAADAANRELEAFSYSVSHDLRAPLRAIDGFSQALLEDYFGLLDEQGREFLNRVRAATQRMAQLIDDLLKLSRLTRGELNIAPVDVSELARAVAAVLQRNDPDRQVTVRTAEGMTAHADAQLLRTALENLIGNAWKFTSKSEQPVIEVGATHTKDKQVFFVRDNGVGFDMTYATKLFGTFQRLHAEKDFPGTGIGLSIVKRIILRHGGTVWAEGEPGVGATFYFTLGPEEG